MKVKLLIYLVSLSAICSSVSANYKHLFHRLFLDTLRDVTSPVNVDAANIFSLKFPERELQKEYDFIVVGSGPAGCVIANRLSENGRHSVLILEAGSPESPITSDIPISSPNLQSTNFNWGYTTTVQDRACLGMDNARCHWPHGKVLGGSSILYYMIYTRGNRRDFDNWAKAGNPGWSWDDVLPYFMRSENATLQFAEPFKHGTDGPLPVEDVPYRTPISYAHVQAAQEAGYKYVDYNSGEQIGVSFLQQSTRRGRRISAARAYLYPVRYRNNLHIATHSTVKKLIISQGDYGTLEVKGVIVRQLKHPQDMVVRARKEVILSAGAFESSKLLMLSGIGPAQHLADLDITPIRDLPVGQTLYEHMGVFGPIFTVSKVNDGLTSLERIATVKNIADYMHGRGGPLTMNGVESLTYIKTNVSGNYDPGFPDIEIMQAFATIAFDSGNGTAAGLRLRNELVEQVFTPLENKRAFFYLPTLLHPRSKGFMQLRSNNYRDQPIFEPNFFSDPRDLETLVAGMKEAIRFTQYPSLQKLGIKLYTPELPTCPYVERGSHDYWRCWAMTLSATFHHQVATCKMGPETDPTTVVDHRLRVHGFSNLRVADIGIIPQPPSGHTNAYSFMIGEKASDMIKEAWDSPTRSQYHPDKYNFVDYLRQSPNYEQYTYPPKYFNIRQKRSANFDWQKSSREEMEEKVKLKQSPSELKDNERVESEQVVDQLTVSPKLADKNPKDLLETTTKKSKISDLHFVLRPSDVDISHKSSPDTDEYSSGVIPLAHKEEFGDLSPLFDKIPAVDEDGIRIVKLDNHTQFERGKNKPQIITDKLAHLKTTQFEIKSFPADNSTKAIHLPVLDGKLEHSEKGDEKKMVKGEKDLHSASSKEIKATLASSVVSELNRESRTLSVYET